MSRTDVHRPYWVLQRDPWFRKHFKEQHDHTNGPCDLEKYLTSCGVPVQTACYIRFCGMIRLCSCEMCGGQRARKLECRHRRTVWRKVRQDILKTTPQDREDVDVVPIKSEFW